MKLIKNMIDIDLKRSKGEHLFVNTLYGYVDVVFSEEYSIIKNWFNIDSITAKDDKESEVVKMLQERKYILENDNEDEVRENLINRLKTQQENRIKNCKQATFVLTYNCNFACPYCYEKGVSAEKVLTKQMVDKVFDLYNGEINNIGFFGGEPLLPVTEKIIKYIFSKAPKANFSIITNGYYLEEYAGLLKNVNITNIQVTLDGTEEQHNKTRCLRNKKQKTYQKIINGIKKYVENNIPVTIRMNVSKENLEDCLKAKSALESECWGQRLKFEMQPLFQCNECEKNDLYDTMYEADSETSSNQILRRLMPLSNFLYNNIPLRPVLKSCDYESIVRFYDPLGNIYSCVLAVGVENKSIGKYFPDFEMKAKSFVTRDITTIKACSVCSNALICGGGCANGLPKNVEIDTPNCHSFINDIQYTIPRVYRIRYGK